LTSIFAYALTVFISIVAASAELFSKFKDEPFKILTYRSSWLYLVLNGSIALLCLYVLTHTTLFGKAEDDIVKAALTAGFGSIILMRSKFFKVNVGDKEVAVGPEMIINVYLETLETKIDRERALIRKNIVEKTMAHIDFQKAKGYVETTILASLQSPSQDTTKLLMVEIDKISESSTEDKEKSLALGYLILDIMGEDFLKDLFNDRNRNYFTSEGERGKND
jgi:hypothetical protein